MIHSRRVAFLGFAVALGSLTVMASGCTGFPQDAPEDEVSLEAVPVDPVKRCEMLVAMPRGAAQEKAPGIGCVEVREGVWEFRPESVSSAPVPFSAPDRAREDQPGGGISWRDAVAFAGSVQRVCGPLAGGGNSDDDVFLNLGRDDPDPDRFQIVIWDVGSLEPIDGGATLCTEGEISLYEGVAQIELRDPAEVEIYG
ncbi:hypothetical protein QE430_002203 [Microbacterium testaceum]|uniref:hypothetical protein n=1 Tax=Microbacterium testaceum TaxID=2033 RepID=UPI00277FAC35|nr:hypothetical protein [Microbacterium testaceum]MDQ1173896.1 hypothetical protein [Microbacterium testaceum]